MLQPCWNKEVKCTSSVLSQCNELLGITVQCTMMMALECHWPFKNHCLAADFDDHIGQNPLTNHDKEAAA